MKSFGLIAVMAAALMATTGTYAQSAAPASGSMTVTCNDGTTATVTTTKGACRGHKGVNKSASGSSAAGAASGSATAATAASGKSSTSSTASASKSAPAAKPAAGGGPGQVWVNTGSKTKAYHCQGSKWYGTTKQGKYMSTSDAQAAGYHAAKGEKCS
ncbi:MAG TPA: hypothetical protein VME63_02595 [Dyella sp.]|uniref:hypothetical protein n=1 Tax=Dyella sp. TaxID=1869338 RepID=UPI002B7AB1D1|nr:hypothetical protein [Dyella sp.]HTV84264.1 hypothetical protein [Dyella sp.]